jgi:hypothetical protein
MQIAGVRGGQFVRDWLRKLLRLAILVPFAAQEDHASAVEAPSAPARAD